MGSSSISSSAAGERVCVDDSWEVRGSEGKDWGVKGVDSNSLNSKSGAGNGCSERRRNSSAIVSRLGSDSEDGLELCGRFAGIGDSDACLDRERVLRAGVVGGTRIGCKA